MHEPLDAERIRMHLSTVGLELCRRIYVHQEIDSTNTWLTERLRSGAADADGVEVCVAEAQTTGRGRRGRAWVSPAVGNLYLSLAWRVLRADQESGAVTLAIGLAVAEALAGISGIRIGLKWPNDLYVGERKLGGILVERVTRASQTYWIVGIGLNLYAVPLESATAVQAAGMAEFWPEADRSRNRLAGVVIDSVLQGCMRYEDEGFSTVQDRWSAYDLTRGKALDVHTPDGYVMHGIGGGVDSKGRLRVICDDVEHWLDAAEVSLRIS